MSFILRQALSTLSRGTLRGHEVQSIRFCTITANSKLIEREKAALETTQTSKTSLVIFDKDGTLICFHSMWSPWVLSTANQIAAESGLDYKYISDKVYKLLGYCPVSNKIMPGILAESTMSNVKQSLQKLLIDHNVSEAQAKEIVEKNVKNCDTASPDTIKSLHNLQELFQTLKDHDIKIAVCTADNRDPTIQALKALNLEKYIDAVVCGDDIDTMPKPHPHNALMICQQLGIDPKEAYMVGDTLADVQMGRDAKLGGSIGVLSGVESKEQLEPHSDHIIPHVGEVVNVVTRYKHKVASTIKEAPIPASNPQLRGILTTQTGTSINNPSHVIIGAGSAGCVLANRLSAIANNRVTLIEAGPPDWWWNWKIHMPAALMYNLCNDRYNWYYHTLPQQHMNQRVMYWPRGRVWGGSSALNAMVYVRGHAFDYDRWGKEGAEGWNYASCLPYFKRAQKHNLAMSDSKYRGNDGPLGVTQGSGANRLHQAWLKAGVEAGYGFTSDMNGYRQEGVAYMDQTIWNGIRSSASRAYLRPALERKNLSVLSNILVTRILFEGRRANGIEYVQVKRPWRHANGLMQPVGERQRLYTDGDVILSGGAINSPQLLMLSGIGPGDNLKDMGIHVRQDMPGVGSNLQDHLEVYVQQICKQPVSLYDKSSWKFPHNMIKIGIEWFYKQTGDGATSHLETGGFVRSRPEVEYPDVQFHFLPGTVEDHGRKSGDQHAYQVHVGPMRPTSTGWLKLKSNDPRESPHIQPNYLTTEQDKREFRDCVKISREIMEQNAFDPYRGNELYPGSEVQTDEQIDAFIRKRADSAYHPSCTCAMGISSNTNAVVDGRTMNVHGFDNLKVIDSSVMPSVVSGNLNAPTIMLAERAADLIIGNGMLPEAVVDVWEPKDRTTNKAGDSDTIEYQQIERTMRK